ncbi:hypothetical protein QFC19_006643 [Naganishia cerealis]|uniref:Uncharacterized protein n=1 Tax=Naganishia cerealis TaxID=610337 RepID=A0ACC2VEV6_9TREE|nr:hypothetical protein QFC19_006643 [Naganishia cerealis]
MCETDVLLCNVTCALPSISTGTRTRVRDAVPASSAEMVAALCEAIDRESVSGTIERNGEYDISSWQRTAQSSPTGAEEGVPTIREILQAIRDLQSHASSSSTRDSSIHTPPAKTGTEQEPLYRPFRTPSSSSFMQEMDMPYRSPSASGGIPHSTADISTLGLPPNSPYSSTAEVTDVPAGPGPSWTDFAQSGFSGGDVTLPKEPFVLGEAFREAPQLAKPPPPQRSQKATALGIGRPGQGMVCGARPLGAYTFKSIGVTRLRSSFFEFERDARRVPRATDGWPTFAVIALDASVIQRFDLRSRYILVLIDVAQPKIPEASPTPIEKDDRSLKPFQSPLQTPPLPPHIAQTGYATPSSDDSEKRNRRRSFFRSFSGGSSKNRKSISSPLSSPSIPTVRMAESPLPRVIEKREPLLTSPRPRSTTKVSVTSLVVSTPSPNHAEPSSRPSMHSQSPSSVYRKPAPVLGQDELRELERSESQTRASIDVRHANDGNDKAIIPITTIDATEDDLELIQSNSLGSSSFTRNNSESPKSLPRRRRSMAPSPASIGDGLTEDDVPVEALDKLALDDEDTRQKCNGAIETTNESQSPSNGQSLNVQPEASNGNVRQADTVEQRVDGKDWGSTTLQAPVTLGASL